MRMQSVSRMSNCCTVIVVAVSCHFCFCCSLPCQCASFFRPTVLILLIWAISASLRRGPLRAASPLLRNLPSESFAFFSEFLAVHEYVFGSQSSTIRLAYASSARLCRSAILRWDNFTLRTASSSRRTSRLRPDGLSTLGIRDTGQNTSKVQDAFRSLHYVAEATCRPPLSPPSPQFPHLILGTDPMLRGARPKKCVKKSSLLRYFLRLSLKWQKMRIQCGIFLSLSCFA